MTFSIVLCDATLLKRSSLVPANKQQVAFRRVFTWRCMECRRLPSASHMLTSPSALPVAMQQYRSLKAIVFISALCAPVRALLSRSLTLQQATATKARNGIFRYSRGAGDDRHLFFLHCPFPTKQHRRCYKQQFDMPNNITYEVYMHTYLPQTARPV